MKSPLYRTYYVLCNEDYERKPMETKKKKETKLSNELRVGDDIQVGGLLYVVTKVEDVFNYVPKSNIRLTLAIVGSTSTTKNKAILFLPTGVPIETLK